MVIRCLQGKSLNLNRPHCCRFSYALTNPHMYHILSNVKWKRWKKLVSGLRWQALRIRHQILGCFPQSLVQSVALKMLSSKSFPFKSRLIFLWPEIYIWQLTAEMTDELPANQQTGPDVGWWWHKILSNPPYLTAPSLQIRLFHSDAKQH